MVWRKTARDNAKTRGQSMVEFALALPILLLVLFGIIEFARMMFFYTLVTTASREGARYGASVGIGGGTSRYLDCNGIRNQALRIGVLAGMTTGNITISYDDGSGTTKFASCEALVASSNDITLGDRIIVTTSTTFSPMAGLVPQIPTFTMSSTTRRTVLKRVVLVGNTTGMGGGGGGGGGGGNTSPTVTITNPADNSIFTSTSTVSFAGTATDTEDGNISANISWSSSIDGSLGTGATLDVSGLSVGFHTIIAIVNDSGGLSGNDNVTIEISSLSNLPPSVTINSPSNNYYTDEGFTVAFAGTASDPQDGDISASIAWTSNIDGSIGSGASFSTTSLSPGTHTITAEVTDSGGLSASATRTVIISSSAVDDPPIMVVTSSPDGFEFSYGTTITFTGTVSDPEDGNISANQVWTSSLDGALGNGTSVVTSSLSLGTHEIRSTVTDSGGNTVFEFITITINSNPSAPVYNNVSSNKSGSTCQNSTVSWTANSLWTSQTGYATPSNYQVTIGGGGSGTTTGTSWNTGSLANNTTRTVTIIAQFPGPTFSNSLTISFHCLGGNLTDITHNP